VCVCVCVCLCVEMWGAGVGGRVSLGVLIKTLHVPFKGRHAADGVHALRPTLPCTCFTPCSMNHTHPHPHPHPRPRTCGTMGTARTCGPAAVACQLPAAATCWPCPRLPSPAREQGGGCTARRARVHLQVHRMEQQGSWCTPPSTRACTPLMSCWPELPGAAAGAKHMMTVTFLSFCM